MSSPLDPYAHLRSREQSRALAEPPADYSLSVGQKVDLFSRYYHAYPRGYVVETGLWEGWGTSLRYFASWPSWAQEVPTLAKQPVVYAIDYQEENCRRARENMPSLAALCGDSAELLPHVLENLPGPAFFWIDAHDPDMPVPLRAELEAITTWKYRNESVVLIDDSRMLGWKNFPTYEEAMHMLEAIWNVEDAQDVIRCVPK